MFALKIVFVVDKIDLHPGCLNRGDLDDKGVVRIVNNKIHPRKPDHFVKLIPAFVDTTIFWHEGSNLLACLLDCLG